MSNKIASTNFQKRPIWSHCSESRERFFAEEMFCNAVAIAAAGSAISSNKRQDEREMLQNNNNNNNEEPEITTAIN